MSNVSKEFEKYEHQRDLMQHECNKNNIQKFNPEIFKKTPEEKAELANAKARYKAEQKMVKKN